MAEEIVSQAFNSNTQNFQGHSLLKERGTGKLLQPSHNDLMSYNRSVSPPPSQGISPASHNMGG